MRRILAFLFIFAFAGVTVTAASDLPSEITAQIQACLERCAEAPDEVAALGAWLEERIGGANGNWSGDQEAEAVMEARAARRREFKARY